MIGTLKQFPPDPFRPRHNLLLLRHPARPRANLELDIPAPFTSRFPISSVRPEAPQNCSALPPSDPPSLVYPRYDPLHILSSPPTPPPYPHLPPAVAPGVLTALLPQVREFLAAAAIAPPACPPLPADDRILALAALSVFYRPLLPAHWVFWNKDQKKATAAIVQSVLDTTPTPIISPIGWIAIPENLGILSSMQHAYAPRLATLPWYAAYVPPEPESRMNLRKRKAPAIITADAPAPSAAPVSGDDTVDELDPATPPPPPRKRVRTRRASGRASAPVVSVDAPDGPCAGDLAPDSEPRPEVDPERPLLFAPADAGEAPACASQEVLAESTSFVQPEPVSVGDPDVFEVRKSARQSQRERRARRPTSSSASALGVRARTRATAASPESVASTLTPPAGTPSRRVSPSSTVGSAFSGSGLGSGSGSSTAVSMCDEDGKGGKPGAVRVDGGDEEVVEPLVSKAKGTKATSRASTASMGAVKNKVKAEEERSASAAPARPKARSRARARRR